MNMESIARYLMIGGLILFLVGGGVYLASKFGIPLGRLPGDIRIEGENGSFYFPVTTSILVSVVSDDCFESHLPFSSKVNLENLRLRLPSPRILHRTDSR
ncbi:MAG: DUF2905 domain-containing protein [Desulfobacterales bacterium]|nr:DUF2905 domain-containing protein [Desulfobacterales bacterium]